MTFEEAKNVSVYDILIQMGGKCVKVSKSKNYALFHAPYREDIHPSVVVDLSANRWRDLAKDYGGDAVDLIRRKYEYMSARDALAYLEGNQLGRYDFSYKKEAPMKKENKNATHIAPLENPVLLDYAASRGVAPAIAKRYCKEAHKVSASGKPYYTLAFPSLSDGYELRNAGFKGAEGHKDISVIGSGNVFLFFEGMFDFLAHIQLYGYKDDATYVVLNSTAMATRAAEYVAECGRDPLEVQLWLDNDPAGRAATALIMSHLPVAKDMAALYAGYEDLNDYCVSKLKNKYTKNK